MKLITFNLGRSGGCLRYTKKLVDNLSVDNLVFSSSCSIEEAPKGSLKIPTYVGIGSFVVSSITILPIFLIYLCFRCIFEKLFGRSSELYFFFPYFHYWAVPIIVIAKIFSIKVISVVHDGVLHYGDGKPFEQNLNNKYISRSDGLIFLTKFVQRNVKEKIGFNAVSSVIPHGIIGDDLFSYPTARVERCKKRTKPNLLFFGRVSKYKGVELLLQALLKIETDLFNKLHIIGKHQFSYDIPEALEDKVVIVDKFVTEQEMVENFNNSDILILPYIEATQSGVAMLGLSARIPMIISTVGGLSEQFSEGEVLFIQPNEKDLSEKLNSLLTVESYSIKQEMIDALDHKAKNLSWNNIGKEVEKFIKST